MKKERLKKKKNGEKIGAARGISNPGVSCLPRGARLTCRSSPIKRSQNVGWKERRWSSARTRKAKGVGGGGRTKKEKNAKGREGEREVEREREE